VRHPCHSLCVVSVLPIHHRGIVDSEPGLYFVGLFFLYAMSSVFFRGVGRDAGYVVKTIAPLLARGCSRRSFRSSDCCSAVLVLGRHRMHARRSVANLQDITSLNLRGSRLASLLAWGASAFSPRGADLPCRSVRT
jgi:hypothetical protein